MKEELLSLKELKTVKHKKVEKRGGCEKLGGCEELKERYLNLSLYNLFNGLQEYCEAKNKPVLSDHYRKMYRFVRRNIPWYIDREKQEKNIKYTVGAVLKYAVEACLVKDEKELTGDRLKKHLVGMGLIRIFLMDVFLTFDDFYVLFEEEKSILTGTRMVPLEYVDF